MDKKTEKASSQTNFFPKMCASVCLFTGYSRRPEDRIPWSWSYSCLTCVLGSELESSGRAAMLFNGWTVSPTQRININLQKFEEDFPCIIKKWHKHFFLPKILWEQSLPICYRQQGFWRRVTKKDACHRARILSSQQKGCTGRIDEQNKKISLKYMILLTWLRKPRMTKKKKKK